MNKLIRHKNHIYAELRPSVKLPPSYTEDETRRVLTEVDVASRALINALKPAEKPEKEFGRALGFIVEALFQKIQDDPAIKAVPVKHLPKQLRR